MCRLFLSRPTRLVRQLVVPSSSSSPERDTLVDAFAQHCSGHISGLSIGVPAAHQVGWEWIRPRNTAFIAFTLQSSRQPSLIRSFSH